VLFADFIKIIGLMGTVIGIELVAALIFMVAVIYLRNQQAAGLIGNLSSLSMTITLIAILLKFDN
jgi:hypothetical protein